MLGRINLSTYKRDTLTIAGYREKGKRKMRGALTKQIQELAMKFLGREMTTPELRLLPYINYTMTNDQKLDPRRCNRKDRDVLQLWREAGHIEGGASGHIP